MLIAPDNPLIMLFFDVAQGFRHTGSFTLNVDETLGASADEDLAEAVAEATGVEQLHAHPVVSFDGVMLPEWTEDVYDGLAGEWYLVEVWRRCVLMEINHFLVFHA